MRETILYFLEQRPFWPFRVHLRCGAVHEVREPALARVTPFTLRLGRLDSSATPPLSITTLSPWITSLAWSCSTLMSRWSCWYPEPSKGPSPS
ncbi:MAG TPA: hypothetical protein VKD72_37645 [Gemmataceae bacterium]|nr:hypothetical protein [Gemmataceae bacterium]